MELWVKTVDSKRPVQVENTARIKNWFTELSGIQWLKDDRSSFLSTDIKNKSVSCFVDCAAQTMETRDKSNCYCWQIYIDGFILMDE